MCARVLNALASPLVLRRHIKPTDACQHCTCAIVDTAALVVAAAAAATTAAAAARSKLDAFFGIHLVDYR